MNAPEAREAMIQLEHGYWGRLYEWFGEEDPRETYAGRPDLSQDMINMTVAYARLACGILEDDPSGHTVKWWWDPERRQWLCLVSLSVLVNA